MTGAQSLIRLTLMGAGCLVVSVLYLHMTGAASPIQQGPPNSPPSSAPPSEPIELHEPPPPPPRDFQGQPRPAAPTRRFNPARACTDAQQLAALANKVPAEVDQLTKGALPKDLVSQLKQIEKLAKRLRGEIE